MQFSAIRNKAIGLIIRSQLTSKVKRFYRDQIWTIVGRKPSIFARRFWAFSGFQKGLALLPSSNGSEVINFAVKITRILEKPARLRSRKK